MSHGCEVLISEVKTILWLDVTPLIFSIESIYDVLTRPRHLKHNHPNKKIPHILNYCIKPKNLSIHQRIPKRKKNAVDNKLIGEFLKLEESL